ncbi:hypothetical protein ACJX0J_033143, partial [Zea mays]
GLYFILVKDARIKNWQLFDGYQFAAIFVWFLTKDIKNLHDCTKELKLVIEQILMHHLYLLYETLILMKTIKYSFSSST